MKRNKISPVLWLFSLAVKQARIGFQTLGWLTLFSVSTAVWAEISAANVQASAPEHYQQAMTAALEMLASRTGWSVFGT